MGGKRSLEELLSETSAAGPGSKQPRSNKSVPEKRSRPAKSVPKKAARPAKSAQKRSAAPKKAARPAKSSARPAKSKSATADRLRAKLSKEEQDEMLHWTESEHRQKHTEFHENCARCRWGRFCKKWTQEFLGNEV